MTDRDDNDELSRRTFLQASAAGAAVGALASRQMAAAETTELRVGLVGCGGRGTGAAVQALCADPGARLTAMADAFSDRLEASLATITAARPDQVNVAEAGRFVGFDACADLLASGVDVVLLATPPGFRPAHLKAAVDAGKHVFCEKPVAVDAPGIRSVYETVEEARRRKLSLVSGFCWRYSDAERETFRRIAKGAIGDVLAVHSCYNTGPIWVRERAAEWSEMEYQMRNWYYFTWLSGDHIVEQAVHSIDKMCWAMGGRTPTSATASGGRQVRTGAEYGHIFDHFGVRYEYADGAMGFHNCRQQEGCSMAVQDRLVGSKGTAFIDGGNRNEIRRGRKLWRYEAEANDMYQAEHDALFASIRAGRPINDGVSMTNSTLMALLGRMSAYTGRTVTWAEALESEEDLTPPSYSWDVEMPHVAVARPGETRFV
ncbi:MAG: Gfo/Idh/MocA family oxidoreductase [Acidobacteriota bacterium]|nr:Gfo/Idh/MocA family oxidoreductase [Acidobacteriota bacterium]